MTNAAAIGYMIRAMKLLGYSNEEIKKSRSSNARRNGSCNRKTGRKNVSKFLVDKHTVNTVCLFTI